MIFRIIPLLLITILLPTWYVYSRFIVRLTRKKVWRLLYWAPSVLMVAATLVLGFHETHTQAHALAVIVLMYAYFLLTLPKVLFTIVSLIGWGLGKLHHALDKEFTRLAAGVQLLCFCCMLYGFVAGYRNFHIKQVTLHFDDLPAAFNGYRIVQFSDLHLGTFHYSRSAVDSIAKMIDAQHADAIVFTGDLVNYRANELTEFEPVLRRLHAPDGVFSIMGNHDYCMYLRHLTPLQRQADVKLLQDKEREMGWTLLLNEHRIIRRGNDSIVIVGSENDGRPPFPQRGDLHKALAGLGGHSEQGPQAQADVQKAIAGKGPFKILLSHDPTHWRRRVLPETNIQLMLAGHTHGMQFEIFGWSPAEFFYNEWQGLYCVGRRCLYVSIGVGNVMLPFRFGAWPEINVITLQSGKNLQTK